jgi:type VI secretion system protein ImpL
VLWCLEALLALWATGIVISWYGNISLLHHTQTLLSASSPQNERQLDALQEQLRTLAEQQQAGTPWYRRFGMDISGRLLPHLRSEYVRQARAQIALPAQRALEQQLVSVTTDPLLRYNHLKALLMLAQPEHIIDAADQNFLIVQLKARLPRLSASHLAWFVSQLHAHPTLRIAPDVRLIQQTRLSLAESMNDPQAEAKRYQQIIDQARLSYADVSLSQLSGDADLNDFYQSEVPVPGAFTRNAWEELVRPAIEQQVKAIQEQTAWVLGPQQDMLSPDAVRQRLRTRYFTDYAAAWQQMLNQITYISQSNSEQLARLAAPNNSPLLALMHQLSWQGLADSPNEAQGRVNSLLAPVFGGLVGMEKELPQSGRNGITLRQWLSEVKRQRDRLRKIDSASDNTLALMNSVFQGTQLDNTAAELPERVQAQLGKNLALAGNALFVAPVSRSWKRIMQQGLSRMNSQWQQTIVNSWHQHFDNTYPFSNTQTDCNLAELGEFIRPDSGKIHRFISQNLKGVLEYRSNRWQPAAKLPPGLTINPAFLAALNHLSPLGVTLFGKRSGVTFYLQPGTAREVVSTRLFIDGQTLEYFNQMPFWQTIQWPGETYKPGASLMWKSLSAGARLYDDRPGQWGFIRLLEKARVTSLGNNRYRLTWTAQDGLPLNYLLDTTAQQNPLDVLLLKSFHLPDTVFTFSSTTKTDAAH